MKNPKSHSPDRVQIVIVGSGLSGLSAALDLVPHYPDITILEKSQNFGGNAGHERLGDVLHPTGGSCFRKPIPGHPSDGVLKRIGLDGAWKSAANDMKVFFQTYYFNR